MSGPCVGRGCHGEASAHEAWAAVETGAALNTHAVERLADEMSTSSRPRPTWGLQKVQQNTRAVVPGMFAQESVRLRVEGHRC